MRQHHKVYYVGMIANDAYGRAIGEKLYAGAATRKMILVARALRCAGHKPTVVSLPFVGTKAARSVYGAVINRDGGVPCVFLATLRSKYLRKLFGLFVLAGFSCYRIGRQDTVIIYNYAMEYIPALVILRLRGVRIVQDIEDAPTKDESGLRGLLNRLSFAIAKRLTVQRKMVVADHVARELALKDYVVVRGVATQEFRESLGSEHRKWLRVHSGGAFRVHYGGTLIAETGVDLFCAAVELIALESDRLSGPIEFEVTGVGDIEKIRGVQKRLEDHSIVKLTLHTELQREEYSTLLDSCHASLSLKRPNSVMASTTFPSKVIEITAAGLALVSTKLGDVVEIFDERSAFFLSSYEVRDLADTIISMAGNPASVEQIAAMGQKVCADMFSLENVGHEMTRLL